MTADNRPVATDATATIGTIIDERAGRDAIHIAVEPVVAGAQLWAGCPVRMVDGKAYRAKREDASGIVDPFLDGRWVEEGQRFWLVLYPRTITSLRHVWSHPDFADAAPADAAPSEGKEASERWIKDWLAKHGDNPGYDAVMAVVANGSWTDGDSEYPSTGRLERGWGDGASIFFSGTDAHGEIPDEFWNHAEIVLGRKLTVRASYFTCSC